MALVPCKREILLVYFEKNDEKNVHTSKNKLNLRIVYIKITLT